jgi:hypothetical protein
VAKLTTRAFTELKVHPKIGRAEAFRVSMKELIEKSSLAEAHPALWCRAAPSVLRSTMRSHSTDAGVFACFFFLLWTVPAFPSDVVAGVHQSLTLVLGPLDTESLLLSPLVEPLLPGSLGPGDENV